MLVSRYRFRGDVGQIALGANLIYANSAVHDFLSNVMIFDIDVLCSFVIDVVGGNCLGAFRICEYIDGEIEVERELL